MNRQVSQMTWSIPYFSAFLFSFLLSLLVFNVKTLVLLYVAIFFLYFLVFKRNLLETTFLTFLSALPIEKPIRHILLFSEQTNASQGYSLYFGITLKLVFGLLLLLLLLVSKKKEVFNLKNSEKTSMWLLTFFVAAGINTVFFHPSTMSVFFGFINLQISLLYYYSGMLFFRNKSFKGVFISFILATSVYSAVFGGLQLQKQGPLNKFIELTPSFAKDTGYTTTDGESQYRVSGFVSHPVYFGSFLSILIPIVLGSYLATNNLYLIPLVISLVITSLGTLSRSVWINLIFITAFFYHRYKTTVSDLLTKKLFNVKAWTIVSIMILALFFIIPTLIIRTKSIPELINNKQGSLYSRLELVKLSFKSISSNPITGIGLNGFTMNYHTAPPHSLLLIFIVELGIPTAIFFVIFIFRSITLKTRLQSTSPNTLGVWLGLITFLISTQFHPLFNLDPTFDLFMLTLSYLSICQSSLKT